MLIAAIVAGASLAAWIVLVAFRGGFWRVAPTLPHDAARAREANRSLPAVTAVVPARNESAILPETLPTVLGQTYPGPFRVVLVDDRSSDGTAEVARRLAAASGNADRVVVLRGARLPNGWVGKVWAMAQGVGHDPASAADYLWFTDADIAHDPDILDRLVALAEGGRTGCRLDLVSIMARLRVDSIWDRLLIPAFVYFFAKLYPFRWVCDPRRRTAGAAGGCMLVRRGALERAGGLERIRSALIDDCAFGRLLKRNGSAIWLGYARGVWSVRRYGTIASIWKMVARSAYDQLRYSPVLLLGTVLGMLFLYLLPPTATIGGLISAVLGGGGTLAWLTAGLAAAAWTSMSLTFIPLLRHHEAGIGHARALPLAGLLYTAMTVTSAWRHVTGRGTIWRATPDDGSGEGAT